MSSFPDDRDLPLWLACRPFLDVRANDAHTLISYNIARALLSLRPEADERIVLPAILFHDVGWKFVPEDKLAGSIGPRPIYPECVRQHEIEGARVAREALGAFGGYDVETIAAIIDGHDTRKTALSLNDALVKDADKLWRFTALGVASFSALLDQTHLQTVDMLNSFVPKSLLTEEGRVMAAGLGAQAEAHARLNEVLGAEAPLAKVTRSSRGAEKS